MKGYRTLGFSILVAVVGVLQTFDWATVVPAQYTGIALAIVGTVNAALRFLTNSPVGKPE